MLLPKRKDRQYFYQSLTSNTLLPLEKIINFVRASDVNLGPKNPQTKISYLARLGLFEDLTSKTTKNTNLRRNSQTLQKLPYSTIARIVQIESLHANGLSYRKILKIYKDFKTNSLLTTSNSATSSTSHRLDRKRHLLPSQTLPKNLISTTELINIATKLNINFGANPKERIRYLIKIGILPQTIKKIAKSGQIAGHLPAWSLERLIYVDKLRLRGQSFPKIAAKIKRIEARKNRPDLNAQSYAFILFSHHLTQRLKNYEERVEKIVEDKLEKYLKRKSRQLFSQN